MKPFKLYIPMTVQLKKMQFIIKSKIGFVLMERKIKKKGKNR